MQEVLSNLKRTWHTSDILQENEVLKQTVDFLKNVFFFYFFFHLRVNIIFYWSRKVKNR
jgi:hypothetical protein